MFCSHCGSEVLATARFCATCGRPIEKSEPTPARLVAKPAPTPQPEAASVVTAVPIQTTAGMALVWVAAGFSLGGVIGFLLRPSVMIIGQLPFFTVVTRGIMLSGIDQLLVPAAQRSFNIMLVGAAVGAAAGLGLHFLGRLRR